MDNSFFLGANSARGFYSFYDELIDLESAKAVYILKGCPGCGKSSLMKKVVRFAEEKGLETERIYCSSDPDSLDGVILPELGKAIVDGTSPHIVEPQYPLAVERYVDLGRFANFTSISKQKENIIEIKKRYSAFFKHIYQMTASAGHIENELFDIALGGISIEKLHKKAKGIISREIPKVDGVGTVKRRFLSAISPKGYITLQPAYSKTFLIEDSYGLGHFLLVPILKAACDYGFSCISCHSPLIPERIEHLLIPELDLALISSSSVKPFVGSYYRKIRLDSMIDSTVIKANKQKLSFLKKTRDETLQLAYSVLSEAKLVHDEIEEIYNPHIDFDALYSFADELICEII